MVHPDVLDAYEQAVRTLKKARIRFRETGGIALNLRGAGRPTKDVHLIVRRSDWLRAIRALGQIATDTQGIRFGLPMSRKLDWRSSALVASPLSYGRKERRTIKLPESGECKKDGGTRRASWRSRCKAMPLSPLSTTNWRPIFRPKTGCAMLLMFKA